MDLKTLDDELTAKFSATKALAILNDIHKKKIHAPEFVLKHGKHLVEKFSSMLGEDGKVHLQQCI